MKRSVFTRVAAIVVFLVILLCIPMRASAYPTSYELNFPIVRQEWSNWCWAACCCAIIDYYGEEVSQSSFVQSVNGFVGNVGGDMDDMQEGLSNYSIRSTLVSGSLSLSQISSNTYTGRRPVLAGIQLANGAKHAVVVIGYINDTALGGQCVVYMDPWYGRIFTVGYSDFTNSSEQRWIESLKDIREM